MSAAATIFELRRDAFGRLVLTDAQGAEHVGVLAVRQIPSEFLRPLVVVMLAVVLVYSVLKKDWGRENRYHGMTRRMLLLSGCVAFSFGFYDGFFGPGTGSFLLFSFLLVGFDFLGAAALRPWHQQWRGGERRWRPA